MSAPEGRLFRLAMEAAHFQMTYIGGEGWRLSVVARRQGEPWSPSDARTYSHLSTGELCDVLDSEIGRVFLDS